MKKNIIALAIASAIAAPAAMAGAPTVYGQGYMSIDNLTDKGTSVNSHSSRIGVKGASDLGGGLKAIYKMEFGLNMNDTAGGQLSGRNAYIGLAGGFGAVLLGRHDTPLKMIQGKDLFNDATKTGYGDNKPMAGGLGMLGAAGEIRAGNAVAYVFPAMNGVKLVVAGVSAKANTGGFDKLATTAKDINITNAISAGAMYGSKKKGLYLAAAYNTWDKPITGGSSATETRLVAQYSAGGLMGNVMYQNFDKSVGGKDGSNIQLNLGYKMGKLMPKFKYSTVNYKDNALKDGSAMAVGIDYALGKKTTGKVDFVSTDKNLAGKGTPDKALSLVSVGILHKF